MIWELLTGGGIAVVAGFLGRIEGFAKGVQQRNVAALFTTGQAESLWCTCSHAMSFHDGGSNRCRVDMEPTEYKTWDDMSEKQVTKTRFANCPCQKFVGDPARNPKPAIERGELDL